MKLHPEIPDSDYTIHAYSDHEIIIHGQTYKTSLIVCADVLIQDWPLQNIDDLKPEHFVEVLNLKPEIVILGTGPKLRFPAPHSYALLNDAQIGVEVMNNGAACRTFNALLADDRKVVACFILA